MYLYGYHACQAALSNPKRIIDKVFITDSKQLESLPSLRGIKSEIVDRKQLEKLLPIGAVHQGIALSVQPLKNEGLEFLDTISNQNQRLIILDQVNDPHNVGAILRSAAVFGASAIVMTERNAPKESGTLAKIASGALELVPLCVVKNLGQALEELKQMNFWFLSVYYFLRFIGYSDYGGKKHPRVAWVRD
jgi:23S rRNA (guanosine2251-2'-O)-methyltransferase